MKKQWLTIGILCIGILILGGACFFLLKSDDPEKSDVESGNYQILDEITEDFEVDIDEMIDMAIFETDKVDEIEELDYLEDHIINMDMLLQKELMTLVPMQILCKDDCKGLCKVCGANLNHETCDCDDFVPDPRLSVFANILKG